MSQDSLINDDDEQDNNQQMPSTAAVDLRMSNTNGKLYEKKRYLLN